MGKESVSLSSIKEKSKELQIPYSHYLAAWVMEKAVLAICDSVDGKDLCLQNHRCLSLESYQCKAPLRLEYALLSDGPLTVQNIKNRMDQIFQSQENQENSWKYEVEQTGNVVRVHLIGQVGEIKIPIELVISKPDDLEMEPKEEPLHLLLLPHQPIQYLHFPVEDLLTEHFIKILKNMELLGDLSSYYIIWDILTKEMNSARKVTEEIEALAGKYRIPLEMERFETICGYRGNPFMKKKWKIYLRREGRKKPAFEEVIDIMERYFKPIWEALCGGNYYLGDWMPELARYLD